MHNVVFLKQVNITLESTARGAGSELSCSGAFCQMCQVHLQGQVSAQLVLDSCAFI